MAGAGVEWNVKENWKISAEISGRQSLHPMVQIAGYSGVPISL
jgi:opacity protein-like surface antigen